MGKNTSDSHSQFIELVKIQEGSQSTLRDEASKLRHRSRSRENDDKVVVDRQTYDLIKQKV